MNARLNTGSTLGQGRTAKGGKKMSAEYKKEAAVCYLNPGDLEALGGPEKVSVSTSAGKVTVHARADEGMARGQVFIPRGPWANTVTSSETHETGSPYYKGMDCVVESSAEEVLDLSELLKKLFKR